MRHLEGHPTSVTFFPIMQNPSLIMHYQTQITGHPTKQQANALYNRHGQERPGRLRRVGDTTAKDNMGSWIVS